MKINDEVARILSNSKIDACNLALPQGRLDRKLYISVNKVIKSIGGKWNRKVKAHVFNKSPTEIVEQILVTGEYTDAKKEYQFFETPDIIARRLIDIACISDGETVLEPSAGRGAIAKLINNKNRCNCVELNEENREYLFDNGFSLVGYDFLKHTQKYDVIVANPPFSKQQDISHVLHMIELSNRCVVSVMSASVLFRDNKKTTEFRNTIASLGGKIESLPDKSFVKSGTNVRTCILHVEKKIKRRTK